MSKILDAENKQFKLNDEGRILFQPDPTNPLPGQPVGMIVKGTAQLSPAVNVADSAVPEGGDKEAVAAKLNEWLQAHIAEVLEPLKALETESEGTTEPVRGITAHIHESMGIAHRSELESLIGGLDQDGRRILRQKKVRLGPVLVFLPTLNKPAAVHLRALLYSLWNDKPLPATVPADGMVSFSVRDKDVDPVYLKAIGYPVYGPRAIRVDMLDRLVGAVYDGAADGKFQARHEMAEWLGCSIPDLYEVLEAMGHTKIHDPADELKAETNEQSSEDVPEDKKEDVATEQKAENVAADVAEKAEDGTADEKPAPQPQEKPELATFRLRKGRAYGEQRAQSSEGGKPKGKKFSEHKKSADKDKKTFRKKKPMKKPAEKEPRVISVAAKSNPDASPFAVLQQLKVKQDDKK